MVEPRFGMRPERSDTTATQKTGSGSACAVFHRGSEDTGGPYPNPLPPAPKDRQRIYVTSSVAGVTIRR